MSTYGHGLLPLLPCHQREGRKEGRRLLLLLVVVVVHCEYMSSLNLLFFFFLPLNGWDGSSITGI